MIQVQSRLQLLVHWATRSSMYMAGCSSGALQCRFDGLLENLPVECSKDRTWNYVAVGCGRDLQWWKEFFSVCHMMGYDGYVSLEMEDLTMSVEAGLETSIDALKATISK